MMAPTVARLRLGQRQPAVVDPEAGGPLAAEPEEPKLTLFERMLKLSRKPRTEDQPIDTLAPEPEPEARDDLTAIPPFMRVQRN
jgi:cell division protein FtsZ